MLTRYFGGKADNLGQVSSLPVSTFAQLAEQYLLIPTLLPVAKADLMAMPKQAQMEAKKNDYLVATTFATSPSQRRTGNAMPCNLIFIDVDESDEAKRMQAAGFDTLLGEFSSVVYHTARSTPEKPRLRIVVSAESIATSDYPSAVDAVAGLLGMASVNRESHIPVQPMFLPTCFTDDTDSPVIYSKLDGIAFVWRGGTADLAPAESDSGIADLDYLRAPVEGLTESTANAALAAIDPDCAMQDWLEIGMGIKHQFGDAGFEIWHGWSAKAKEKYPGEDAVRKRWDSFKSQTTDRAPVTIRTLLRKAEAEGWDNSPAADQLHQSTLDWIESPSRSTEELVDHATKRIAKAASYIGPLRQATLIGALARVYRNRELRGISATQLTADVKRHIAAAARAQRESAPPPVWSSHVVFVTASNLFYRYVDNRKMRPEVVDLIYRSPDPEMRPREWLVHEAKIKVVEALRYDPSTNDRIIIDGGCPYCNTYRPTYPAPDASSAQTVADIIIPHAKALFGDQWHIPMMDFLAYHVQYPGRKVRWAPVIQSGLGAGKGFFAELMSVALGHTNVQRLSAEHVLEGTYNGWVTGYQLTFMDEIRVVGANRHRVMDKLKTCISDSSVSVRNLYEPVTTTPNRMNFVMFTNHKDALAVHDNDRRYFVIHSPLQNKAEIDALGGEPYFDRLYALLRSHPGGIRAFLESWPISPSFRPDGRAPETPFLKALAMATASPLAAEVQVLLEDQPHALVRSDLVSISALRTLLPTDRLPPFTDQGLASVLREKGYSYLGRFAVDGARHSLWALAPIADPAKLATERLQVL